MNHVKILIVEDEIIVAKDISASLEDAGYRIVGIAENSGNALELFNSNSPDIVLMDINIKGEMDGIQTALAMKEIEDIPVIFITAFADDATVERAKKAKPSAYIVKPFNERELNIAINLAISNAAADHGSHHIVAEGSEVPYVLNDYIFVKNNSRFEKLDIKDILYIESAGNYSTIYTENNRFTLICTLSIMNEKLARANLMRVHRSFLINVSKVKAFEDNRLFIGDKEIPIGKTHKEEFFKRFRTI